MSQSDYNQSAAIALGRQMTVEFYDCSAAVLADAAVMEKIFLHAAEVSGAHVVNSNFHSFEPQGVSGVVVISESHFAVHAWPEHDYAAVDLFTCGSGVDFDLAVKILGAGLKSGNWIISSLVNRGILHESGELERLVPVVENHISNGLQLSWEERFKHSGARAISACVDIYNCRNFDFTSAKECQALAEKIAVSLNGNDSDIDFEIKNRGANLHFICSFDRGRVSGFASTAEKNLYLDIFTNGFFDPRGIAECAMTSVDGTYYRMQVQIRQ